MKRMLLLLFACTSAYAHDFWIEPSTFRPAAGARLAVALRVGEQWKGEPVPRRPSRIESFVLRSSSGARDIPGLTDRDPAGIITVEEAGISTISYRGNFAQLELSREKFLAYLNEEGATGLPVGDGVQRERYRRFSKSLVRVGDARGIPQPLNERFELVVLDDPWSDAPLRLRAVFDAKPVPDLAVFALSRDGARLQGRTDKDGVVSFALKNGVWLLKATRITAAPKDSGVDWESNWASLTFER
jgi:uncharacterized GH25 family protein